MSDSQLLDSIQCPEDLRKLPKEDVKRVTEELRADILHRVSRTGGHLASSLGAVELITAIHYVFDTPNDRLVMDVGHQGHAHKMLTGRREGFGEMGKAEGIGKFPRRCESPYDTFGVGHAGTSISAALGMARGLEAKGLENCAIALIGDGGMTAGMAFEALNHGGALHQKNLIVVLNDNEMSISPNVGALSSFMSRKLSAPMVRTVKGWAKDFLSSLPGDMLHWAHKAEESLKAFLTPAMLFEAFNFRYVGPVKGNDIEGMLETLENVKGMVGRGAGPILVHAMTAKGFGYGPAQADPMTYHGVSKFDVPSGKMEPSRPGPPSYTGVFANALTRLAKADERVLAITAAMPEGTGLDKFQAEFPERFFDVGIAEQHAVTFGAGLATEGLKPVVAIYSTFLQRAFDQVLHDVCLQNLDVTFALDRAGLVGGDGATHQGIFDYSFLRSLPNLTLMAPKDENELQHLLATAVETSGPSAIRYPRGAGLGIALDTEIKPIPLGESELLRDGKDLVIIAIGSTVHPALEAAVELAAEGISAAVINSRFVVPMDVDRISALAERCGAVLTVEEHMLRGGFGSAVAEALSEAGITVPTRFLGFPEQVIEHGDPDTQRALYGIDADGIAAGARKLHAQRNSQ
jgi:1-deoxy-D-xylulose-5-phosphate synthase